jgi:hypothetical protein
MRTGLAAAIVSLVGFVPSVSGQWSGYGHDAQHTGVSPVASQPLNKVHWSASIDTILQGQPGPLYIHYGTPVITAGNTVLVPQRTSVNNTYQINAFVGTTGPNGAAGTLLYTLNTAYTAPPHDWIPSFGTTTASGAYYYPGPGGTIYRRLTPDSATGTITQLCFYGLANYQTNTAAYNSQVIVSTPLTADRFGNIYFGFVVTTAPQGQTPVPLTSGLARITPAGVGSWVSAYTLGGGSSSPISISRIPLNCAPAINAAGTVLYVAVSGGGASAGYLVAVNPTTLTATARTPLIDPLSGSYAAVNDDSSAAPTIGPDGDVYYGVLESDCCSNHDRGWLLHFNGTLSTSKLPGAFGWDTTPSVVAKNLVPSYAGASGYLLLTKYNNYKEDFAGGNGLNYVAVTDPNNPMTDPITGVSVMNVVIEVLGPMSDAPPAGAVREWCINSAAVDPNTKSAIINSEDGMNYRWDFTTNSISQKIYLTNGVGEAYTPTVIGPDGTVYAINDATLFAIGQ